MVVQVLPAAAWNWHVGSCLWPCPCLLSFWHVFLAIGYPSSDCDVVWAMGNVAHSSIWLVLADAHENCGRNTGSSVANMFHSIASWTCRMFCNKCISMKLRWRPLFLGCNPRKQRPWSGGCSTAGRCGSLVPLTIGLAVHDAETRVSVQENVSCEDSGAAKV